MSTQNQKKQEPVDLDGLVKLTVEGAGKHGSDRRYQLMGSGAQDNRKWFLESQNRGASAWHSNVTHIAVTTELAELLKPMFPVELYAWRSRSWLTLKGICKRLGKTDIAKQVRAAEKGAKATQDAVLLEVLRREISDHAVEQVHWVDRFNKKNLDRSTDNVAKQAPNLSGQEIVLLGKLRILCNELIKAVPYTGRFNVGDPVKVADGVPHCPGIVLGMNGREYRVDVKKKDGSTEVLHADASKLYSNT